MDDVRQSLGNNSRPHAVSINRGNKKLSRGVINSVLIICGDDDGKEGSSKKVAVRSPPLGMNGSFP